MVAKIIDGKRIAEDIKARLKENIEKNNLKCKLAIIQVGDIKTSETYLRMKKNACDQIGILYEECKLSYNAREEELIELIGKLNKDANITGILLQLPLPGVLNKNRLMEKISPEKDVDCFNPINIGKISLGGDVLLPATPKGVLSMLKSEGIILEGKDVVILNRSNLIGKPLSSMLTNEGCTVTVCHSKTMALKEKTKGADILVVAIGVAGMIKNDFVKEGAIVIDVGISFIDGRIKGDVDFEGVKQIASYISPVPGGVGPMTVASLMENIVKLSEDQIRI